MSQRPVDCYYTEDHEWIRQDGDSYLVGITDHAQGELGDVVYIDLPKVGSVVAKGDSMFTVESVKAVSDIYAPAGAEVIEVHSALTDSPQLVNEEPFTGGWMVKLRLNNSEELSELLKKDKYDELVATLTK